MSTKLLCRHCLNDGNPRLEQRMYTASHETRMHLGAFCTACESWLKWVPQNDEWAGLFNRQHDHPMYPHEKRTLKATE